MIREELPYTETHGLYVAAFLSAQTNRKIAEFQKKHNIPNPVPEMSLHSTIVQSKAPVENFEPNHTIDVVIDPTYCRIECWDTACGKTLVLVLFSPYLEARFQHAISLGATYDFDEYKPHITLSYDVGDWDHKQVPLPDFTLEIAGEYSEPIYLQW